MSGIISDNVGRSAGLIKAAGGGGKIGQMVTTVITDEVGQTSTTFADISGMTQAITCTATSSKVLIEVTLNLGHVSGSCINVLLLNGSTGIFKGDANGNQSRSSGIWRAHSETNQDQRNFHISYIDSPNSTSAVTYKMQWCSVSDAMYLNRTFLDEDTFYFGRTASNIICSEILA